MTERCRVRVVSGAGVEVAPGVLGADPDAAVAHIEKLGWMTDEPCPALGGRSNPRIELDDGNIIWGYQCWWSPVAQDKDDGAAQPV